MTSGLRARVVDICGRLPEAEERETWGEPTWRVCDRIFTMERSGDGRLSLWMKAPPGAQEVLIGADPKRFFVPPYVGPKGWIGIYVDDATDWSEVEALVTRSYRLVAPKRLARLIVND
jgi:predicted DNA-binding protein (MmcQ/YjbR family)